MGTLIRHLDLNISDMKENIGFWIVLFCTFSFLVIVWFIFPYISVPFSEDSFLYSLAQIQASIFAIVISLTLVAVQLSSQKYSIRISRIFLKSWSFWGIVLVYFVSIFFDISAVVFLNLIPKQEVFIGVLVFLLTFVVLIIYIRKTIEVLSPENLVRLVLNSITLKEIEQYVENPKPFNDKFLPIKEFLNVAAKNGEFEIIQVVTGGVIQKFGEGGLSGNTKDDPLWKYFERLVSVLLYEEQKIKSGPYSFSDYEDLEEKKRDIKEKIYLYLMCFLEIPNNILENAKKLKNLRLFYLGFWAFNAISLALMDYFRQFIDNINSMDEQTENKDLTLFMFKDSIDNIIGSTILYYISLHSKAFVEVHYEEKPHDIYTILMTHNLITKTYEVIGTTCADLDLLSSLDTVAEELSEVTLSFFKICPRDIKKEVLDTSIHTIGSIINEILLALKDSACSEEKMRDLVLSFNSYLSVLEEIVETSINAEIEASAINGIHVIAMPLLYIQELLKNNVRQLIRNSIVTLSSILTNMQVDTSELKLKQDAAIHVTKMGIRVLNRYITELGKNLDLTLLELCINEIKRIYEFAHERCHLCWPYPDLIVSTSESLVHPVETLVELEDHESKNMVEDIIDIISDFVKKLLDSSKIPQDNKIKLVKLVTTHLIYLGFYLMKMGKENLARNIACKLQRIDQDALKGGISGLVDSAFQEIENTKEFPIYEVEEGVIRKRISISKENEKFLRLFKELCG